MKTLYFDCPSGISGDMTVAALLDLGADAQALRTGLQSLRLEGYRLEIGRVRKNAVNCCDFQVILGEEPGHSPAHPQDYRRARPKEEEDHRQEQTDARHHHRGLGEIRGMIMGSEITPRAKQYALRVFEVLAKAEAKVHALPVEEVGFHEVGAVDSIVDIVGAAILIDHLNVERIVCSPLSEGQGRVKCGHGWIPVPVPATLEIVTAHQIPIRLTGQEGELVTPTGAAIVAALADEFASPGQCVVLGVGYGAGKRDYPDTVNALRALLVEEGEGTPADCVCELSCNLDDIGGEALAFACEELTKAGALDVWLTPVTMKKGRPGHLLSLLCPPEQEADFARLILRHTSTIGVRSALKKRTVMNRGVRTVETPYGPVEVKESTLDGVFKVKVEFESAKAIALGQDIPINMVLNAAYIALSRDYSN